MTEPTEAMLQACVQAATAAPSIHNSQPWLFRIGHAWIDVLADRRRRLEIIDPSGREMLISVGAAVFTLRVAMRAQAWTPNVTLFPDATEPDLVARVSAERRSRPSPSALELAAAVPHRHTNRLPFAPTPIPPPVLDELASVAGSEGATLHIADTAVRQAILGLARTAERRLRAQGIYRTEQTARAHPAHGLRGVPPVAFGPWDALEAFPLRDFGLRVPQLHRSTEPPESSPTIAVLSTEEDGAVDWVRSGQAVQGVLLVATARGLAATPMSQPLQIPALRELVMGTASGRWPQVILRLGYAPPTSPTPRRPLADMVLPYAYTSTS